MKFLLILLIPFSLMASKPTTIRILLTKLAREATIEVKGPYSLYNPHTDELIETHSNKKKGRILPKETGLQWSGRFNDIYELRIVPKEGPVLVNGIPYKGFIEVYNIAGTLNIINEVDIENYLKSTLTNTPLPPLSKEALDALVITERTNLYYLLEQNSYTTWQLVASQTNYTGISQKNGPIQPAVERTRDLILNYKKKPFPTSWGINHAGTSGFLWSHLPKKNRNSPWGAPHISQAQRQVANHNPHRKTLRAYRPETHHHDRHLPCRKNR